MSLNLGYFSDEQENKLQEKDKQEGYTANHENVETIHTEQIPTKRRKIIDQGGAASRLSGDTQVSCVARKGSF